MAVVTLAGVAAAGVDTIYLNAEVDTPAGTVGGLPAEIMLPDTTPSVLVDGFVNNNEFVSSLITLKPRGDDAVLTLHLLPDGSLVIPLAGGLWSDSATPSTVGVAKEVDSPATLNVFVGDVRTDVDSTDYETGQAGFAKFGVGFRSETAVGDGKRLAEARAEEAQRDAAVPIKATAPGGVSFTSSTPTSAASPAFTIPHYTPIEGATLDGFFRPSGSADDGVFVPRVHRDPAQKPATLISQSSGSTIGRMPTIPNDVEVLAGAAALGLLLMAPWLLYHRIRGHKTLENGPRKAIYDAIVATPGLGVQEVADRAGISYSTASYHLDRLLKARMIVVSDAGGKLRYYKNGGAVNETERALIPLLQNQEAMRVLESVLAKPGTYRAELATVLGVSVTAVNWHLKRLLEAGLITEVREGRSARLFVDNGALRAAMAPLLEKMGSAAPTEAALVRRLATEGAASDAAAA